jgi:hypothetical protein
LQQSGEISGWRAKICFTKPAPIGSETLTNTIGITRVSRCKALVTCAECAITSGPERHQLFRQRRYLIANGREPNIHIEIAAPSDHPSLSTSVLDLELEERDEVIERLLPAEITGLERDGRRQALLDDIVLRPR